MYIISKLSTAELHNPTENTVDLSDYYITDNEDVPLKFRLSGASVEPGGYIIIYLSGLDRTDSDGVLHAGFRLSSEGGETLILSDKHGRLVSKLEIRQLRSSLSISEKQMEKYLRENR